MPQVHFAPCDVTIPFLTVGASPEGGRGVDDPEDGCGRCIVPAGRGVAEMNRGVAEVVPGLDLLLFFYVRSRPLQIFFVLISVNFFVTTISFIMTFFCFYHDLLDLFYVRSRPTRPDGLCPLCLCPLCLCLHCPRPPTLSEVSLLVVPLLTALQPYRRRPLRIGVAPCASAHIAMYCN